MSAELDGITSNNFFYSHQSWCFFSDDLSFPSTKILRILHICSMDGHVLGGRVRWHHTETEDDDFSDSRVLNGLRQRTDVVL